MTTASRRFLVLVFAGTFAAAGVRAGDTSDGKATTATATEEQPEEYNNWIELGIGGVITSGDRAQFEQEHRLPGDQPYGGIQDLHLRTELSAKTASSRSMVTRSGISTITTYTVELSKPNLGYIKAGFTEFRSWYDGNGGFFPHDAVRFSTPAVSRNAHRPRRRVD